MQQASGISAETQSKLAAPTTTATATANQMQRSDTRSNYRTLTMENTGLSDLYWFITQMAAQHMKEQTAVEMLGQQKRSFSLTPILTLHINHYLLPLTMMHQDRQRYRTGFLY